MPTSSRINACRAGSTSIRTPSASSVSAVPAIDDAARDPCLTTFAPAPAATIAIGHLEVATATMGAAVAEPAERLCF